MLRKLANIFSPKKQDDTKDQNDAEDKRWVVFTGFNPGIYDSFERADAETITVPNNQKAVFSTPEDANCAYREGIKNGIVQKAVKGGSRVVFDSNSVGQITGVDATEHLGTSSHFYVLTCGRAPGIYGYDVTQLRTGVSGGFMKKFNTFPEANAFLLAELAAGRVIKDTTGWSYITINE